MFARTFIFCFFLLNCASALKVLQVVPGWIDSLRLFNNRLAAALSLHKHNVTLLEANFENPAKNFSYANGVNVIKFFGLKNATVDESFATAFNDMVFKNPTISVLVKLHMAVTGLHVHACGTLMNDQDLLDQLQNEKFDFAFNHIYAICSIPLLTEMKVPTGFLCAGTYVMDALALLLGIPFTPSFIPNSVLPYTDSMGFKEKLLNFIIGTINVITFRDSLHPFTAEANLLRSPPYEDREDAITIASDIPLLLLNGDPSLDFPRPTTGNIHYTGNLDRKITKTLSSEWQERINNSPNGFILFSLGTVANTSAMPTEWKVAFLEGLGRFSDISVFWRFEGDLPNVEKYPNIKLFKWLPQPELLEHPKCRLFLTHGGYSSFLETAQSGKPVVMVPLFFDQLGNARRAERFGLGLYLDKMALTADKVADAVGKILAEKKYELNAKKLSKMLSDKIRPSEDLTIEHIERIARHYKNFPRVSRSVRKLSIFQYFSLDILTLFTAILLLIFYGSCKSLLWAWRFVDLKSREKKKRAKLD